MVSELGQGYMFLANILNVVKIEKLTVPDVIQSGSSDVVLDCQFICPNDFFTIQWWFGASSYRSSLVYEWTPRLEPIVSGVLEGRLDLSRVSDLNDQKFRAIRLLRVDPELSGEYTCVVTSNGVQVRESKRMLVFNPEEEFELTIKTNNYQTAEITCLVWGVYPQPELILEHEKEPFPQQIQRVWHMNSILKYDAESKAELRNPQCGKLLEVTCRLHLPQADYTAMKKKLLNFGDQCSRGQKTNPIKYFCLPLVALLPIFRFILTIH